MKRMKMKYIVVFACFSMALNACNSEQEDIKHQLEKYCIDGDFKGKITFENPSEKMVTEAIPLTGSVETNPDNVIHFISLVGGVISNTFFSLGDKVVKGQVLAELKSTELTSLQAELKNLESQIRVAKKNVQVVKSMYEDGISSMKELIQAQSELEILESGRLKVSSNLNLFSASSEKGVFQIKAPATGIVTAKSIASGMQISAESDPLFTISDLSEVWVMVNIHATNVTSIQEGMTVDIKTLSYPGQIFKGKVSAISQVYDNSERVLKARVVLHNDELKLKPGMLVDVLALREVNQKAISIPTNALVFDDNQQFLVVYHSDCDVEIRKVEILSKNNGTTFLASGLSLDEKFISKNQLLIYEQLKNFQK